MSEAIRVRLRQLSCCLDFNLHNLGLFGIELKPAVDLKFMVEQQPGLSSVSWVELAIQLSTQLRSAPVNILRLAMRCCLLEACTGDNFLPAPPRSGRNGPIPTLPCQHLTPSLPDPVAPDPIPPHPRDMFEQCSRCWLKLLIPSLDLYFSKVLQTVHLTNGTFSESTVTITNDFQTLLFHLNSHSPITDSLYPIVFAKSVSPSHSQRKLVSD